MHGLSMPQLFTILLVVLLLFGGYSVRPMR
jgi:hypothetical protein